MHNRLVHVVRISLVLTLLAVSTFPFLTGCDFIDQLIGGGIPGGGTGSAINAVITAKINDPLVAQGLNPDLRPPLMYDFSAVSSLDQYGDPIHKPNYEVGWDFGDGETRGFEWGDYVTHHRYFEEGTHIVTLTVRQAPAYGSASATAQKTITIGPGWLEIISLTTENRPDGDVDVTVVVRNQSHQDLGSIQVDLLVDGVLWSTALLKNFSSENPDHLAPNGTYTLRGVVGQWTGTLTARSSWCVPI